MNPFEETSNPFEVTAQSPAAEEMRLWGPDRAEGVRKYVERMGHGFGIAYGYSKRFIEAFGPDRLPEVISARPHELLSVARNFDYRGFSSHWNSKPAAERAAMMAMLSYRSITYAEAAKICQKYRAERAASVVKDDPYQLSLDIDGIGFERADKIAEEGGTAKNAPKRLRAALYHALRAATDDGDLYVTRRDWISKAEWLIGHAHAKKFSDIIEQLIAEGHVYEVLLPTSKTERVYYPRTHYLHEVRLAAQLRKIAAAPVVTPQDIAERLANYETTSGIALAPEQREAVLRAGESALSIITGGPGTGKTTIVRAIVDVFEGAGHTLALAAFAGCAAKRLRESTGAHALTIHKTLAYDPSVECFTKDANDPVDADVVVLDETSMIDVSLLDHATQAVRPGARLVLVGDVDQLPSIGPGAALRDVIESGIAPVTRLETIFRQSKKSRIVTGSRRIRRGATPVPAAVIDEDMRVVARPADPDVELEKGDEPLRDYIDLEIRPPKELAPGEAFDAGEAATRAVVKLVAEIEKRYGIPSREVQVLSPMRVRSGGADALNKSLQAALNPLPPPPAPGKKPNLQIGQSPRETVSAGDKVMQVKNDYNKGLYNGDIGYVESIAPGEIIVDFRDGQPPRRYTPSDAANLRLAYASTIHKSQGSEYPCVVLVILRHQAHMFSRNGRSLFYTAVTRGKKLVFVVHDEGAIERALGRPYPRQTLLRERLQGVPVRYRVGTPKSRT
jgi:exodeoxyribonuclease V alpha subunit